MLSELIGRRSKKSRACACPRGTQKTFVGRFGIRCGRVAPAKGGGRRWRFTKTPKRCNY